MEIIVSIMFSSECRLNGKIVMPFVKKPKKLEFLMGAYRSFSPRA
jgi:hypothetical protein